MSLLGTIGRGLVGFAGGGPIGAVTGVATGLFGGRGRGGAPTPRPPMRIGPVGIDPSAAFPGGRPLFSPVAAEAPAMNGQGKPSGYHLNKSSYYLRDGTYVPKGTKWVKNRRRNAMNPRALRRAIQRVDAAKSWQSSLSDISTKKYTASGKRRGRDCR